MKKNIYIVLSFAIIIAVAGYFMFNKSSVGPGGTEAPAGTTAESGALGGTLYNKIGSSASEAVRQVPNVNPFSQTETNPYAQGYTNPFGK